MTGEAQSLMTDPSWPRKIHNGQISSIMALLTWESRNQLDLIDMVACSGIASVADPGGGTQGARDPPRFA